MTFILYSLALFGVFFILIIIFCMIMDATRGSVD
jgi:hypothetical protein